MQRVVRALLRKAANGRAPSPVGIGRTDKRRLTRALGLPAKELEAEISAYRLDQIESLFADDPWAMNILRKSLGICCSSIGSQVIADPATPLMSGAAPAMIEIRAALEPGPLFNMCTKCPGIY
jgi:hypothetical protein